MISDDHFTEIFLLKQTGATATVARRFKPLDYSDVLLEHRDGVTKIHTPP
jgi:hypothetical protein